MTKLFRILILGLLLWSVPASAQRTAPKPEKVHNVILMIGDGMGLSQIVAAFYANKGLTTLQMKYMGLQQNNALDAFTTDSAAGGSALATGERHDNRHISMSSEGEPYPSLSDFFHDKGMPVGVLTLGNVADLSLIHISEPTRRS